MMYPNYNLGYMPQPMNAVPRMQQMYPQYQQAVLKGRPVTGIDEARAAQIDLDGSMTYFPSPAEGRIYEKSIGLDGMPIFKVYRLEEPKQVQQPVYAESSAVALLQSRIEQLENIVKGMSNNVQPDGNGTNYEPTSTK